MFGLFLACIVSSGMFHSGGRERSTVDAMPGEMHSEETNTPHDTPAPSKAD
ncbi:hypothetical protein [Xylella fastidiosa]|nr:hypothetical protein [Xylella fastidiosa]MDG5825644.1 hypothetical protein [Xylella fastidiosa subsp. pauca]WGZ31459.1 hypothetical protein O4444_07990 [Xylella fastidiosa subsp. pauca]WGZ33709.1 hypothetical protein O4445_08540 [Xylella fastidiosa subsp. pauca]